MYSLVAIAAHCQDLYDRLLNKPARISPPSQIALYIQDENKAEIVGGPIGDFPHAYSPHENRFLTPEEANRLGIV